MPRISLGLLTISILATLIPPALHAQDLVFRNAFGHDNRFRPDEEVISTVALRDVLDPIFGLSFGVVTDAPLGDVLSVDPTPLFLTANNGAAPDFIDIQIYPEGFTVEATICTVPCPGWAPPNSYWGLSIFEFTLSPTLVVGQIPIGFSSALGTPPVPILVEKVNGPVPFDEVLDSSICVTEHEEWEFVVLDEDVPFDRATGAAEFTATLTFGHYSCYVNQPVIDSPGFAFGLAHDPSLLEALEVRPAPAVASINGGNGPDFFMWDLYPDGVTLGCVASFVGSDSLQFPGETPAVFVDYQTQAVSLAGAPAPIATTLSWSADLGSPPVAVFIMPGDSSIVPQGLIDGTMTLIPEDVAHYIRGDVNEDGGVDVADVVSILAYLFQGGVQPTCTESGDINTDGGVDVADPICILGYLFSGGHPPHAPFPDCGSAGMDDCPVSSAACP